METWLSILYIVGGVLAYVVTGGVVHAIVKRIDMLDSAEDVIAIFWPLFAIIGPIVVVGWCAVRVGTWTGGALVEAIIEWRERPKLPRATARRKGGQ